MNEGWFTSRYSQLFWHWGASYADWFAPWGMGSPHYFRAVCGASAGASPYIHRGKGVPPRWVEVDRQSRGTAMQSRRRCPECLQLLKRGRRAGFLMTPGYVDAFERMNPHLKRKTA